VPEDSEAPDLRTVSGGCHCKAIRFEAQVALPFRAYDCNCSICRMTGYLHLIIPRKDFRPETGEATLSVYEFNTRVAKHSFCSVCGIKSFYIPRSHPDGVSINVRCLDDLSNDDFEVLPFDGSNWESNVERIR
jgi:hypothetical protein